MENTFITMISMQGAKDLERLEYQPSGFELEENIKTAFPIMPIIKNRMHDEGTLKIIAVVIENEDVNKNYEKFIAELKEIGIEEELVEKL